MGLSVDRAARGSQECGTLAWARAGVSVWRWEVWEEATHEVSLTGASRVSVRAPRGFVAREEWRGRPSVVLVPVCSGKGVDDGRVPRVGVPGRVGKEGICVVGETDHS